MNWVIGALEFETTGVYHLRQLTIFDCLCICNMSEKIFELELFMFVKCLISC